MILDLKPAKFRAIFATVFDALLDHWHWLVGMVWLAWLLTQLSMPVMAGISVALIGLPLLLRFPWLVLPLFAAILPVSSGIKIGPVSGTEILLAVVVGIWFADGVRQRSLRLSTSPPVVAGLLYALFLFVVLLHAINFAEALPEMLKWFEFALLIAMVQSMVRPRYFPWLVLGLLSGGILQGIIGLYQFVFRIGPDWFFFLGQYMRAYGSFSQPNPYAGYLGLSLPVAISFTIYGWQWLRDWQTGKPPKQNFVRSPLLWGLIGIGSAAMIGLGILLSWSRGGWLGALAGLATVLFLRSRRSMAIGGIALLVLLSIVLAGSISPTIVPSAIESRLADLPAYFGLTDILSQQVTDENFAVIERVAHWAAAIRMWRLSPWIGVGPGNYATVYPSVKVPGWDEPLGHAHNIYLNVLAETGIWGLVAFLGLWGLITLWLVREILTAKKRKDEWQFALLLGILGVIVHLTVHNIFDNLFVQGIYLHLAFWIGVASARYHSSESARL